MTQHTILSYSDKLFTPSESFIPRAYHAFDTLKPIFIGHEQKGPTPDGTSAINLNDLHGPLGGIGYKQFGVISDRLLKTLTDLSPVAIHANFGKSGAYALPLARKLNLPLIVTYHGGDATKHSNTKDSPVRIYNRRRSALWKEAALILPVSDFIRGELAAKGAPEGKMIVHYNGVDPERFVPGEKKNILQFAGRLTEKKGIKTLINALGIIQKDAPDLLSQWTVRLLGNDTSNEELVNLLDDQQVSAELPGWINADDMPAYYAEAAIMCVPSNRAASGDAEGLPMVCIEAMLSGCAVAATRHAGIPECVIDGETGVLVDERDHKAYAEKLINLMRNPEKTKAMGEAGRARAQGHFNLNTQSKKLEDHILSVARAAGTI